MDDMDDLFDISQITGNASDDIKRTIGNHGGFFQSHLSSSIFGGSILKRMKVVEISLNRKAEEEKKMEARVVVELDVTEGQYTMLNPYYYLLHLR
jgi:acyl-coenzyme A thioesterase 13